MLDCLYCPFQHVVLECQGQMVLKGFLYAWPWWGDHCLDSLSIFLVLALEDQNQETPGTKAKQDGWSPCWVRLHMLYFRGTSSIVGEDDSKQIIPQRHK